MLSPQKKSTIFSLFDADIPVGEIARRIGCSVSTVQNYRKSYLNGGQPETAPATDEEVHEKIAPFRGRIDGFVKKGLVNSSKIFQMLQGEGYDGSYALLNSYVRETVAKHRKGLHKYRPSSRLQVVPGEEAQVDWGSFGAIRESGRLLKLSAFIYILSYSRAMYVEFVASQNEQTLQACHMHAFEKLGMPRTILYDNMKTVVLSREKLSGGEEEVNWHPGFLDFATYHGFTPRLCHPYHPRSKGKVEAGVKYLRNNFMAEEAVAKTIGSLEELNRKAAEWVEHTAQQRIHRGTGERPLDLWMREKELLQFHEDLPPYSCSPFMEKWSTKDGIVHFKRNLYQVSAEYAQKKLHVREVYQRGLPFLEIYYKESLVCTYQVSPGKGEWISDEARPNRAGFAAHVERTAKRGKSDRSYLELPVPVREPTYYDAALPSKGLPWT